uniref:probable receptor-like protein kinase At1g30570 n=1 Tax=Erigeron canadensis TaxID=72917 RepID=UPI001CB980F4|nr:probable receptor-like protein kinase At1g30570 [Erigeron canadensis]
MDSFMKEFEHLKISLEEINKVTNNFNNKPIGSGGFGKVYEAGLSHSKGRSLVAIKRLDRKFGQGDSEIWKEIVMLTRYSHENLISLLGFCDEAGEKVIVYELASNGSLDQHLSSSDLTWKQRIKICLGAAKGLCYLHDDKGTQQRVIHRDVKSSNILLDGEWKAKVSDMGLSKLGPANQVHTALLTNVVGTLGYLDPVYLQKGFLTKESDVYSFGVVLFEVLCGRLCFSSGNLVPTWKKAT